MRKGRRWLIAGILAVLWLGLLVFFLLPPRFEYQPTGDELFDRTMLWVMREHRRLAQKPSAFAQWLAANYPLYDLPRKTIDYTGLQALEAKYGEDPRYWQLLLQIVDTESTLTESGSLFPSDPLLSREDYYSKLSEGIHNVGSFYLVPWHSVKVEEEELFQALMDLAISSDPDNSFFYYCKADYVQIFGELDQAVELTRLGNTAAKNYLPLPFIPQELLKHGDNFYSKESKEAAVILNSTALYNYIQFKERYKEQCIGLALGLPIESADVYITRARRMGQMENVRLVEQNVAAILANVMFDYVSNECIDLTEEQQGELDFMVATMNSIVAEANDVFENNKLGAPLYVGASSFSWPTPVAVVDQASWDANLKTRPIVEKNRELFDILDPPPFAIWARGELVGIDVSEVLNDGDYVQDMPGD